MPKKSILSLLSYDYCKKYQDMPTWTLSKLIYKENKKIFKNLKQVWNFVQYHRGKIGKRRKYIKDKDMIQPLKTEIYNIPISKAEKIKINYIDDNFKKILLFPDIHIPYHDEKALEKVFKDTHNKGIDCVYINGDFMDFYELSNFEKDPRLIDLSNALEVGKSVLKIISKVYPKAKKYYKIGNHDARLEKYLFNKAPELIGVKEFELKILLDLYNMGYDLVKSLEISKYRGLNIYHGHEVLKSTGGVNAARSLYLKTKSSGVTSHLHQNSEHTERTINGKVITTWSTGCLCPLDPHYDPYNTRWTQGYAIIHGIDNNQYNIENIRFY